MSIVLSLANYLLAGWFQHDGVFILGSVASLHVTERRVGINKTSITQILQRHQVLGLTKPAVKIAV